MCPYGPKAVLTVAYLIQGLTVIMLFWTHDVWLFFAFAAAFGIGYGGEAGGFPILNRRYYGFAPVGSAHGFQMLGAGLGMALGGWIGGVIFDMMGNYDLALIISVVASVAGAVSILLLEPTNRLLIPTGRRSRCLRTNRSHHRQGRWVHRRRRARISEFPTGSRCQCPIRRKSRTLRVARERLRTLAVPAMSASPRSRVCPERRACALNRAAHSASSLFRDSMRSLYAARIPDCMAYSWLRRCP